VARSAFERAATIERQLLPSSERGQRPSPRFEPALSTQNVISCAEWPDAGSSFACA
jgi:hypothetical protein